MKVIESQIRKMLEQYAQPFNSNDLLRRIGGYLEVLGS